LNFLRNFKQWLTKDYDKRDTSSLILVTILILFIFLCVKYQWGEPLSTISNLFGSLYFIVDIIWFFLFIILIRVIEDGIRKIVNRNEIRLVSSLLYIGVLITTIIIVNQYYL